MSLADDGADGHTIAVQPSVWSTVNDTSGTSPYTRIPLMSDFRITAHNGLLGTGTFTEDFVYTNYLSGTAGVHNHITALGGQSPLSGQILISILRGIDRVETSDCVAGLHSTLDPGLVASRSSTISGACPRRSSVAPFVSAGGSRHEG